MSTPHLIPSLTIHVALPPERTEYGTVTLQG